MSSDIGFKLKTLEKALEDEKQEEAKERLTSVAVSNIRREIASAAESLLMGTTPDIDITMVPHDMSKVAPIKVHNPLKDDHTKTAGTVNDIAMGVYRRDEQCTTCGGDAMTCPGHLGRLDFPEGYVFFVNPLFVELVPKILASVCQSCSKLLIQKITPKIKKLRGVERLKAIAEKSVQGKKSGCPCIAQNDEELREMLGDADFEAQRCVRNPIYTKNGVATHYTANGTFHSTYESGRVHCLTVNEAFNIITNISDDHARDLGYVKGHPRDIFFAHLPIIPPCARPSLVREGEWIPDKLTNYYNAIVENNVQLTELLASQRGKEDEKNRIREKIKQLNNRLENFNEQLYIQAGYNAEEMIALQEKMHEGVPLTPDEENRLEKLIQIENDVRRQINGHHYYTQIQKLQTQIQRQYDQDTVDADRVREKGTKAKSVDEILKVIRKYINEIIISSGATGQVTVGYGVKSISFYIGGKEGTYRKDVLTSRAEESARTVITPGPTLRFGEIGVPAYMAKVLTKKVRVNFLNHEEIIQMNLEGRVKWIKPLTEVSKTTRIQINDENRDKIKINVGDTIGRELVDGDEVIFNRQPSLWKKSIMSYRAVIFGWKEELGPDGKIRKVPDADHPDGSTVKLHMAATTPHNADFDGDEGAIHVVQDIEAETEAANIMNIESCIMGSGGAPTIGVVYDSLTGAHLLTRDGVYLSDKFSNFSMIPLRADVGPFDSQGGVLKPNPDDYFVVSDDFLTMSTVIAQNRVEGFDLINHYLRCKHYGLNPLSGKSVFSMLLPDDYTYESKDISIREGILLRGTISKKDISGHGGIIQNLNKYYSVERVSQFLNEVYFLMTEFLNIHGFTIGISDCVMMGDDEKRKETHDKILAAYDKTRFELEQLEFNSDDPNIRRRAEETAMVKLSQVANVAVGAVEEFIDEGNNMNAMISAGSKGKKFNFLQVLALLGQVCMNGGRFLPKGGETRSSPYFAHCDVSPEAFGFVKNSFSKGLPPQEFVWHAAAARVGLVDSARGTAEIGAQTRNFRIALGKIVVTPDGGIASAKREMYQPIFGGDGILHEELVHIRGGQRSFFDAKFIANKLNQKYGYSAELNK